MQFFNKLQVLIAAACFVCVPCMTSCGGGGEEDEPQIDNPGGEPNPDDEGYDFSGLYGYWLNEDESCMIEFRENTKESCTVNTYIPKATENSDGTKYETWSSRYSGGDDSFSILTYKDAWSFPAIYVEILTNTNNMLILERTGDEEAELTSYNFYRIDETKFMSVLKKGWNSCVLKSSGKHKGREYVDLGLSVKWATANVDDSRILKPTEFGGHYAFAETRTKSSYTKDNSFSNSMSLSDMKKKGIIDGNNNLTSEYDCASYNWESGWRIPTNSEWAELVTKCDWLWISTDGVNGALVIGKTGNAIFIPAAGRWNENGHNDLNEHISYGTGTVDEKGDWYVWNWSTSFKRPYTMGGFIKYGGFSIRPVLN